VSLFHIAWQVTPCDHTIVARKVTDGMAIWKSKAFNFIATTQLICITRSTLLIIAHRDTIDFKAYLIIDVVKLGAVEICGVQ
jgi:hypothetical protein